MIISVYLIIKNTINVMIKLKYLINMWYIQ